MKTEIIKADVLCVGGGLAGLMAAIRASELGAKVVVAEKGNTIRSGAGRVGCDHFFCYIPEVHGSVEAFLGKSLSGQVEQRGPSVDTDSRRASLEMAFEMVKLWDEWGIPMKYNGKWEFAGHAFPGQTLQLLKYAGQNQKPILTKEALKRGVKIVNRVMVFELLGDADGVTGALGIDTREDKLVEFQAKSVILGTGQITRMYPNITPALISNDGMPPTLTGDGRAMAYRLGAELAGLEVLTRHVSPKYFAKGGIATWIGVYRDPQDRPIGPFVTKPDRKHGDNLPEVDKSLFARMIAAGKGPVYMDCRGISDEDLEYMMHWMGNEGNLTLFQHLKEEGVDLRKNPIEFITSKFIALANIRANVKGETTVRGLYATGDESRHGVSDAAVFGWLAGENASKYAKEAPDPDIGGGKDKIERIMGFVDAFQNRERGPEWEDANIALQQVMYDYAGPVRTEAMLNSGLSHLRRLNTKMRNTLKANNRWELTRCLEVVNLYDLAELIFLAALERKETRQLHHRFDYPLTNPMLNSKLLIVKNLDGKPVLEWKERI